MNSTNSSRDEAEIKILKQHHWVIVENSACLKIKKEEFYEVELSNKTLEIYRSAEDVLYQSKASSEEEIFINCRKLNNPSFVEEV